MDSIDVVNSAVLVAFLESTLLAQTFRVLHLFPCMGW